VVNGNTISNRPQPAVPGAGSSSLLQVKDLKVHFVSGGGLASGGDRQVLRAVDGVSFSIQRGEVLGLVGESGCGKSTVSRAILQLIPPTGGTVFFDGTALNGLPNKRIRKLRRRMQMIFQDPYASLNPSMTVEQSVAELLKIHRVCSSRERRAKVREILKVVELSPDYMNRYPHEFSGGQRQRICIARALVLNPDFLVADEPVSALDVSVQAQIINLLQELQERFDLTYLFISHDLSVVRHISNRIAIMYLGRVVELSGTGELYENPLHPYSQALLSAVPVPDPEVEKNRKRIILHGEVPGAYDIPAGCRFNTRCWKSMEACFQAEPELREIEPGHFAACYLYSDAYPEIGKEALKPRRH
jgi:oligopeptide transport system ATP-binding protein